MIIVSGFEELKENVKIKESEIDNRKKEISSMQTKAQIEALKSELENLKMLVTKEKSKRRTKKK